MIRLPLRPTLRLLAAAGLLLAGIVIYRIEIRGHQPMSAGRALMIPSRAAAGPWLPPSRLRENRSPEAGTGSAPPGPRLERPRPVARDEHAILLSPEALEPYAAILASLGLPPDRLQRLRELIVEREESAGDAAELSKDYRLDPENAAAIRAAAEAAFAQEITDLVGSPNDQTVLRMLSLKPQLARINQTIGRDLAARGEPLSAEQLLQLAQEDKDSAAAPPAATPGP